MKIAVFCALGVFFGALLILWLTTCLRYRISSRCLKVVLFGVCLRRIAYEDIGAVSKRRPSGGWAEYWCNTLQTSHRMLVIHRRSGWFRYIIITPKNRYVFKTELERAIQTATGVKQSAPELSLSVDYEA